MAEKPSAAAAELAPCWRPSATIAVCTFAGPLIGVGALLVPFAVQATVEQGVVAGLSMLAVAAFPLVWAIALLICVIPAAIGGIVLVAIDRYASRTVPRILAATLTGGVVTAVFWLVFAGGGPQGGGIGVMAAVGAVSGGVCSYLTRSWRYRED